MSVWTESIYKMAKNNKDNTITITGQSEGGRQISHSTDHGCAGWCRRWSCGRCQTFGPWRCHRGKLLWLVVESRGGDFKLQGGCHHDGLAAAGLLHFKYLSEDKHNRPEQLATGRASNYNRRCITKTYPRIKYTMMEPFLTKH